MAKKWSQLTPREQHERAAKLAQNPGTRAAVPDKYLRGFAGADKLRAQRATNTRLNAPVVAGSDMTYRDLVHQAAAQTTAKYGPEQRALAAQMQTSQAVGQQIPQWFADYRNAVANAQTQTQQAYTDANRQLVALQGQTAQTQGQDQAAQLQSEAAQRGGTADPAVAQQAAQAAQIRQALVGSQGGALAAQGASQSGYLTNLGLSSQKGQTEAMLRELAHYKQLESSGQDLAREMGAYDTAARSDIADHEQQNVLERATFGLNQQKAQATAEAAAARAKQTAQSSRDRFIAQYGISPEKYRKMTPEQRVAQKAKWTKAGRTPPKGSTADHYGYSTDEWSRMSHAEKVKAKVEWDRAGKTGTTGGKPNKEPASSLGPRRQINTLSSTGLPSWAKTHNIPLDKQHRGQLVASLRKGRPNYFGGAQEKFLSAALDLAINGQISKPNLQWLRQNGVYVTSKGEYYGAGNA